MTISVVQTLSVQQSYSGSFASNVTAGNSVVFALTAFTTSGATMSSSAPLFNGGAVTGGTLAMHNQSSTSGNNVYAAIWLMPNLAGGAKSVAVTVTNGGSATAIGFTAWEVSGLGATPAVDQVSPNTGKGTSGTSLASGSTPAITGNPEFIAAVAVSFGNAITTVGAPWTEVNSAGGADSIQAEQIVTSSGGTYSYAPVAAGSADWVSMVATISAGAGPAAPPLAARQVPGPGWHPGAGLPGTPGGTPFYVPPPSSVQLAPAAVAPAAPATGTGAAQAPAPAVAVNAGLATGSGKAPTAYLKNFIAGLGGTGTGYFADQNGKPRMVCGDAVWALPGNAGRWSSGAWQADYDTYFSTRAGQGFTVAYTKPIGTTQSGNLDDNGKTFDALYPFQGGSPSTGVAAANPSTGLTAAFWARIDYMLNSALSQGITVFFNAIGYNSDFNGGPGPLNGKSSTEFQAYGTALGARYASQPNLVWHLADDYFGGADTLISAFMTGVRGAGDTHAVSIENYPETDSRNDFSSSSALPWGTSNAQYNFCYSYNVTYWMVEQAYLEASPITVIQGDGYFYQGTSTYAGGSGAFAYDRAARQDAWHAISSGARGVIQGDEAVWQWASTAAAAVANNWYQKNNMGLIRTYVEGLTNWQNLIPDTSSVLVTAGRGTHASGFTSGGGGGQYEVAFTDSYVTASRCADKSLAIIYMSHGSTITIDTTQIASGFSATWVDPVTLATSAATAGSTYNSTAKGNNSQGDPDWVLVLQQVTAVNAPAVVATGTGAAQQPSVAVTVNAGVATGTGAAKAPVAAIAVNAVAATGTGTAQNATVSTSSSDNAPAVVATGTGTAQAGTAAITVNAGVATGTGTAQQASVATSGSDNAPAQVATGTGAAQSPAAGITVFAVIATGTGTAQQATVSTAAGTNAPAGLASGSGAAQQPKIALTVGAFVATGTGAALNANAHGPTHNAVSNPAVTLTRTSSATVTAGTMSTSQVSQKAAAVPTVSGG